MVSCNKKLFIYIYMKVLNTVCSYRLLDVCSCSTWLFWFLSRLKLCTRCQRIHSNLQ